METLHSERFIRIFTVTAAVLILLVCVFLSQHEMRVEPIDVSGIPVLTPDDDIAGKFDDVSYEMDPIDGERMNIRGWAVIRGRETRPVSIHVLLRNRETGQCFRLPTEIKTRSDVTEQFRDDYTNYDSSGFVSSFVSRRFDFSNKTYDVLILYELSDGVRLIDPQQLLERKGDES